MAQITETQHEKLAQLIYEKLMENPEMGMGEMGECKDEASRIVDEWCETENIEIKES